MEEVENVDPGEFHPPSPWWVRAVIVVIETLAWLLTLGRVKRIEALEEKLHYAPRWRRRDRAEQSIGKAFRSGVGVARRLVQPLLHIETDLFHEDGKNTGSDAVTPRTRTAYEETLKVRHQINARIRTCLRDVPVSDLEAPFLVNACTWNVDQHPPPVYEDSFLSWLIGPELVEDVKSFQERKQAVLAGGSVNSKKPSSPTGTTTIRHRKVNISSASKDAGDTSRTAAAASAAPFEHQQQTSVILDEEWQALEMRFPDLLIISLQEVEMTRTALVKELTQRSWEWTDAIIETLSAASDRMIVYRKIRVVQLVGLVLIVLIQERHMDYVSHVRLSLTRTGALAVLGNKGSVAMRVTIYGKRFLFISAHFEAHKWNEKRRMKNYMAALNDIQFKMPVWSDDESEVLRTFMKSSETVNDSMRGLSMRGNSAWDRWSSFGFYAFHPSLTAAVEKQVLDNHDYIFFLGDLNSRLHAISGSSIRQAVTQEDLDYLLCHDELRQLMVAGEAFDGFQEQWISFPPTYKYDRGTDRYDTSCKCRDPAWCDRVLFRILAAEPEVVGAGAPRTENAKGRHGGERSALETQSRATTLATSSKPEVWVAPNEFFRSVAAKKHATVATEKEEKGESSSSTTVAELYVSGSQLSESETITDTTASADALPAPDIPESLSRQMSTVKSLSRAPSHAMWESKQCAPTFCAARRSRTALTSSPDMTISGRFPMIKNHIHPLEYTAAQDLRQSDHRPVRARFEVKVISLEPNLVRGMLEDIDRMVRED